MNDVMLLERQELTSGSSWHAAGGVHGLHDTNNIARLQYYTMNLYRELEQETGQSVGFHQTDTSTSLRPKTVRTSCGSVRPKPASFWGRIPRDQPRRGGSASPFRQP